MVEPVEPRSGALSYSVETDTAGPSIETTIAWGSAAAVAVVLVGLVAAYLALNVVPSQRLLAWGLGLAVPAAAFGTASGRLRRSSALRRRKAGLGIAVASLVGMFLVVNIVGSMRPTFPQLASALSDSALPDGYERVREERVGDRLCHDVCPRVERYYRAPAGTDNPVREMVLGMYDHGWRPADANVPPDRNTAAVKDGFRAEFAPQDARVVKVTITPTGG
jgi:hypothetical protein